ncbi:MAG: SDR family oxidoreductase [Candidatus Hydrogenedentes bacterium]|nr:SDR family oxidoreductase [Candidatus Hydrogenedentota bacterium]
MSKTEKLLVTGYGGFVAGSVVWQALRAGNWDVYALSLDEPPRQEKDFHVIQFDLLDDTRLRQVFTQIQPKAVIHTAALADIDYCENHPDDATRVNVGITRDLAGLCAESGARMTLCSTDTVFDGRRGMYVETDAPNPLNHYAQTKVEAEETVRTTLEWGVIARLSLVMGLPVLGAGNSFLAKMIDSLQRGEKVKFPANEVRTPIDVITLGGALLELAATDFTGTIHLAGSTRLNRYQMACQLARDFGYSDDAVMATDSNAMEGRAPRPNDASLDNTRAKNTLRTPMRPLMDGLRLVKEAKAIQTP